VSLPSISLTVEAQRGLHTRVLVYAGPDVQHRAFAGSLMFRHDEALAFADALSGAGYEVRRVEINPPTRGAS
jgi:hypothetical protein